VDAQRHNKHYRARTRERRWRRRNDNNNNYNNYNDNDNDNDNVITERGPENGDGGDLISPRRGTSKMGLRLSSKSLDTQFVTPLQKASLARDLQTHRYM
jgi:hypothetical protein